jgi:hypothetical protein
MLDQKPSSAKATLRREPGNLPLWASTISSRSARVARHRALAMDGPDLRDDGSRRVKLLSIDATGG